MTQDNPKITVKVKLFAIYQEIYQNPEIIITIPEKTTIQELYRNIIIKDKPELKNWENITRFAVNFQFVSPDFTLKDQDEVALIPPVSGG